MFPVIKLNKSVSDIHQFFEIRRTDAQREYRAIQLALSSNKKEFVIEKIIQADYTLSRKKEFQLAVKALPIDDCRYLIYFIEEIDHFKRFEKIMLISWLPDSAQANVKNLYISNRSAVKSSLKICAPAFVATNSGQLKFKKLCEKAE